MDTEALAVTAVKNGIAKTDYLTAYINEKDKEPMWDGAIYAYSSKKKTNENWIGKAFIQVKGKNVNDLNMLDLKYDLQVVNMKNYKKDGGIIFFVVAIDPDGETKVFYNALTPFYLNKILDGRETQGTIRVDFQPFPISKSDICNVITNFIRDSRKQKLFTQDNIPSLEEFLSSAGKDLSFGFQYSGMGFDQTQPYKSLFGKEIYMYATNTKLNIDFPIEHIMRIEAAKCDVNYPVTIDGKRYYNEYGIVHKENGIEIHIGKSVVIDFPRDEKEAKIHYKIKGNIKERIQDIQFITDLAVAKKVEINGVTLPLAFKENAMNAFRKEDILKYQKYLKKIDGLLVSLGVEKALEVENLPQKSQHNLQILELAFIKKQSIHFEEKVPMLCGMEIGNIYLILYAKESKDGKYCIKNFPDIKLEISGEYDNGEMFITSKYVVMKCNDIIRADNLKCSRMVDEVMNIHNDGHYTQCNYLLLEMLKAYDKSKRNEILDEAIRLADWLRTAEILDGIADVNYYQCLDRKRKLSETEEDHLMSMLDKYYDNELMKAGIQILLKNKKMAKRSIDKLDDQTKQDFLDFPIYELMGEHYNCVN